MAQSYSPPGQTPQGLRFQPSGRLPAFPSTPIRVTTTVGTAADETCDLRTESGERCQLVGKYLAGGGEGRIYRTDRPGLVAKIYLTDTGRADGTYLKATTWTEAKLRRMLAASSLFAGAKTTGICWPRHLLFDQGDALRGYLMPEAPGTNLEDILLVEQLRRRFPEWDRRHLVRLCITLLQRVQLLHDSNVLLGDINARNVLIQNENSVWLVDTDSYQLEGFPSPVGTDLFLPPELLGIPLNNRLRTPQNEAFSLAVLLFMVLHLGLHPYTCKDGGSVTENTRAQRFPFAPGQRHRWEVPDGAYKYVWSHLSMPLQQAFYQSFHARHRHEARISTGRWFTLMEEYLATLDEPQHRLLVPTFFKGEREITCVLCRRKYWRSPKTEERYVAKYKIPIDDRCPECRYVTPDPNLVHMVKFTVNVPSPDEVRLRATLRKQPANDPVQPTVNSPPLVNLEFPSPPAPPRSESPGFFERLKRWQKPK